MGEWPKGGVAEFADFAFFLGGESLAKEGGDVFKGRLMPQCTIWILTKKVKDLRKKIRISWLKYTIYILLF